MDSLLEQVKKRRIALALKQHDMFLRVGISRQQYQRLESKGNPRLDTLELIAKGLKSELLLVPQDKMKDVLAVLADEATTSHEAGHSTEESTKSLNDDPWQGLLGEND
ncbi:helix-turn-helix domain-containing protein [Granulosicoccus antarcticus]|uniref:HTH cro/C1-type domain-containing protein n=1 Tax=Granulosicoccus antarcticus IMCC3135 TaxID=1192854 RepID=A0A2Z2NJJ6_9GAMM|nr:helix-turn-helix transcriptional regulator [Granulosicoccus antarcticus]ASJ70675.1 hypothetical protein IMCC3135_02810 [Granulosicoccus antarcticus IMCC3135]